MYEGDKNEKNNGKLKTKTKNKTPKQEKRTKN